MSHLTEIKTQIKDIEALRWSDFTAKNFVRGSSVEFAIKLKCGGRMVGLIGLDHINAQDSVAELCYRAGV